MNQSEEDAALAHQAELERRDYDRFNAEVALSNLPLDDQLDIAMKIIFEVAQQYEMNLNKESMQ